MSGRGQRTRRAVVTLAGILLAVSFAVAPAGAGSGRARAAAGGDGGNVGIITRDFVDRGRRTPSDPIAGITPSRNRRLPTTIYYPARGAAGRDGTPTKDARPRAGPFPLVLFNPGSPGTPQDYEVLLADWARNEYVVAAIEFPVSSVAGPDAVAWKDLPAQTEDAVFVLDRVLDLDPAKAGIPEIDADRIAAVGHSFGGATALSLVAKCCRDGRVDAAVVLAGVTETVDGPALRKVRGPVLFVHARRDRAVPYAPAVDACAAAGGPKRFLTVEEIRGLQAHVLPYLGTGDSYSAVVRPAIVDFLDGYLRDRRSARHRIDRAGMGTMVGEVTRCRPDEDAAATTATPSPSTRAEVTARA